MILEITIGESIAVMDTKPTNLPAAVMHPPRTIQDVEAELTLNAAILAQERAAYARAWPSRITDHYANHETPAVRRHNALLDEWVWWRYDDTPTVTRTGGANTKAH